MKKKLTIKPHLEAVMKNIDRFSKVEFEQVSIVSYDGLKLVGNYYESCEGAPLFIFFHGYRSSALRDGSGGFWHLTKKGYNVLLVDQRSHGKSDGRTISFGINERRDCISWINYVINRFGKDVKIILMGVSMGASTVLMASEQGLPDNVKGIVADCGYSSPKKIIKSEIKQMKMPACILYPLAKLSARIFGGFNLDGADTCMAVSKCSVPILIIHGEGDRFVPYYMAKEIVDACRCDVTFLSVPNAGHAMSFYQDMQGYTKALDDFAVKILK
ncbi:MAG: alpha/beta hydrolase [Clostridia bacterium]|nr:alpha/beta hydrolase [Clostridia bacterium]